MNKKLNVFIVAHKFLSQPDDDLLLFMNHEQLHNVMHITHDFSDAPTRMSHLRWYTKGELKQSEDAADLKGKPEFIIYIRELLFTTKVILKSRIVWDVSINMDGLCTLFSMFLKSLGRVRQVVYWAMDFVPEKRFVSGLKNVVYEKINTYGYKNADEMWDLSPRMAEAREKFLRFNQSDYKKRVVVPYGMWLDRIRRYSYEDCDKNTLVFMGHLIEKQGVQLVLRSVPQIVQRIPNFMFTIIGTGKYEGTLKKIVEEMKIQAYINFVGKVERNEDLEAIIAKSCVAVAPYVTSLDTWTRYADPGKIKSYLACGVPVLLTDISWNAKEIEEKKCGILIEEDTKDIVEKLFLLMTSDINQRYRYNVNEYAKSFDYKNIFNSIEILK